MYKLQELLLDMSVAVGGSTGETRLFPQGRLRDSFFTASPSRWLAAQMALVSAGHNEAVLEHKRLVHTAGVQQGAVQSTCCMSSMHRAVADRLAQSMLKVALSQLRTMITHCSGP